MSKLYIHTIRYFNRRTQKHESVDLTCRWKVFGPVHLQSIVEALEGDDWPFCTEINETIKPKDEE